MSYAERILLAHFIHDWYAVKAMEGGFLKSYFKDMEQTSKEIMDALVKLAKEDA